MFIPTVRNDANTAATAVFNEWVCVLGFPIVVQSDQEKYFASQVFEMYRLNGMKHRMGSVSHVQSQGQVEHQNQLLNHVKALCDNKWTPGWSSTHAQHFNQ